MKPKYRRFNILVIIMIFCAVPVYSQGWQWAKHITGNNNLEVRNFTYDQNKNIIVLGQYTDQISAEATILDPFGGNDIFLAKYDPLGNLVWIKRAGSTGNEDPFGLVVDNDNNIFIAGGFRNTANFSDSLITSVDGQDVFLVKYQPDGTVEWAKNVAWGPSGDRAYELAISSDNTFLISGIFKTYIAFGHMSGSPTNDTLFDADANRDNFVAKYSYDGDYIWSKQFACNDAVSLFRKIAIKSNDVYVTGSLGGTMTIEGTDYFSTGLGDVVLIRMNNTTGIVEWVRKGGGTADDQPNGIAIDIYDNVYVDGYIQGTATFDSTATITATPISSNGGADAFLCKYNSAGNLQWIRNFGDADQDVGYGLCVNENILIFSGYFTGEVPFNNDTIRTIGVGNNDAGFGVFDVNGNAIAGKSIQGDNDDRGQGIGYSQGESVIAGYFTSTDIDIGTFTLTNANPGVKDVFIANYQVPFSVAFTHKKDPTCNNGTNGELTVTPFFGTYPYTYEWSHNPVLNDSTATGLAAGTYEVIVTDANLKKDTLSIELTEPAALNISDAITDVLCHPENGAGNDGTIDITVTGGTPGYTYSWTTLDGSGVEAMDEDQFTLTKGTYYVDVTDDNGCVKQGTFLVSQPQQIFFNGTKTDITVPPGSNGTIDLSTTGGTQPYVFAWTGPKSFTASTEDLAGLVNAGTYVVDLTDDHTCTADTNITVLVDTMLIAYVCDLQDVQCHGESNGYATVCVENGSGDYNYYWTNSIGGHVGGNNATLSNMPAGTYYCEVTDNISLKTAEINPPAIIEEPAADLTLIFDPNDLLCNGDNSGSIDLTISGGTLPYSFSWTGPNGFTSTSEDIDNLEAGFYSCIVTDANGCTTSLLNYEIEEPPVIGVNPIVTDVLCYGEMNGTAEANASGGTGTLTYLWDDPAAQTDETAEFLEPATYHVTVTDANGCKETGTAVVDQPDAPLTISETHQDVGCNGGADGTISLTVSGGTAPYDYTWDDGPVSKNRDNLSADTYCVTVTDANNCSEYLCIVIDEPTAISIDSEVPTDVTGCPGDANGTITITASGGISPLMYSIDDGANYQSSGSFTGLTAGDYQVKVKDANDCEVSGSLLILNDPIGVEFESVGFTNPTCPSVAEGSIIITVSGGAPPYQYSIDDGNTWQSDNTFAELLAGSYFVWVQDDNGCMFEFDLNPVNLVAGSGVVISNIYGANDCMIEIDAVGTATPFEYSFDGGLTYGTTNVFPTDSLCEILGDTIADLHIFEIVVKDDNGCTDTEIVELRGCPSRCNPTAIWEAITPNGDGYNDEWDLQGYRNKYPDMVVRIYNTWGNLVFESARGYPEPWDGTKDDTALPAGTYFYVIDRGDGSDPLSGTVNIVK